MSSVAILTIMSSWLPSAPAGTVTFDPPVLVIDSSSGAAQGWFDIAVDSESMDSVDNFNIIFGSEDVSFVNWEFASPWPEGLCHGIPCDDRHAGWYASDLFAGSFALGLHAVPNRVGRLLIDASGLSHGDHTVFVDADRDLGFSSTGVGLMKDPLYGSATVRVMPEPSMVMILAGGAIVWMGNRRMGKRSLPVASGDLD